MADEQIRIDVTAEDDASKVLEAVADDAEALEKQSPEVTVTADTDQATRGIKDVADEAQELSRKDWEILLRAKIDDAKSALKSMRDDLDRVDDKARDTGQTLDRMGGDGGLRTRGNAIADLTGPLGDASGAASDFAGVFDGLGDIAEDVAGRVGLSAAAMSTAIGGIGIAVAAGAAAWTFFRQQQEKARAKQKELVDGQREINDAIRDGNAAAAAGKFQELYGENVMRGVKLFGLEVEDVTDFVTGQSHALDGLIAKYAEQDSAIGVIARDLQGARDSYDETNGSIEQQDRLLAQVTKSFERQTTAVGEQTRKQENLERQTDRNRDAFDRLRGALSFETAAKQMQDAVTGALWNTIAGAQVTEEEISGIKDAIFNVAEFAKLTPIQVASLLQKVDQGQYQAVLDDLERISRGQPADVYTQLRDPSSYDIAEYRRRLTAAVGVVPIQTRADIRGQNGQLWD